MIEFRNQYIAVLRNEINLLKTQYYNPQEEGTGHFNTAISVLQNRIQEIENGKPIQIHTL